MLLARARRRLDLLDGDRDLGGQELLAVQVDVAQVLAARRGRRRGLQAIAFQLRAVTLSMYKARRKDGPQVA